MCRQNLYFDLTALYKTGDRNRNKILGFWLCAVFSEKEAKARLQVLEE